MARRRSLFKLKLRKQTVYSLFSLALFGSAGLLLIAVVIPNGQFLGRINHFFSSNFGWGRILLAIIMVQLALALAKFKISIAKANSIIGLSLVSLSLWALSTSGSFGESLFAGLYSLLPVGFAVFFVFLLVALFGLTVFLNISLGEAAKIIQETAATLKAFFQKYFHFASKAKPVFVKDNLTTVSNSQKGVGTDFLSQQAAGAISDNSVSPVTSQANPKPSTGQPPSTASVTASIATSDGLQNTQEETKLWEYPPINLFSDTPGGKADRGDVNQNAAIIEKTLEAFGITARVAEVNRGPAVTQYALEIAVGTKLSKIMTLQNDLALALAAPGQIRIEAPIPGRSLVGIEIPNRTPESVTVKQILDSPAFAQSASKLTIALGLNVSGQAQVADIAKMPHALIAGATGSGKSVSINALLASLLYRNSPAELKLILVDPKRVELSLYNGIPHLLTPVIVEVDKVLSALKWAITEMERRYKLFASVGVRNMEGYNELAGFQALPYLIIVIDEMADVMMFAPVEVEDAVCRLAQMARATGIHLILSTQRPSVDVITGLIKANIPCRIAFNVTSMIDSRVIIDAPGAEKLLGRGDMLYIPPDQSRPSRIQGAFISDSEVHRLVDFLKAKGGPVQYTEEVTSMHTIQQRPGQKGTAAGGGDQLIDEAIRILCQFDRASASLLQRKLSIGYARAARILDTLEELGIVGPGEGSKPRDVLVRNADEYFASRTEASQTS